MEKIYTLVKKIIDTEASIRSVVFNNDISSKYSLGKRQLSALIMLKSMGKINMTTLAKSIDVSNQQLTKVVDNLVQRKLVKRSYDKKNRRIVLIEITKDGREYIDDILVNLKKYLESNSKKFNEKLLDDVIKKIDEVNDFMKLYAM